MKSTSIRRFSSLLVLLFCIWQANATLGPPQCNPSNLLPNAHIQSGYCPTIWASGLNAPRQVTVASNGDVLVVESGAERITVLWDSNNDGVSSQSERAVLASYTDLNHAVVIHEDYLYASNAKQVVRWKYQAGNRSNLGKAELVINNIPCCHHNTRTLRFDSRGYLYVQSGSASNVDPDSSHSRVNRFDISTIPENGIEWNNGYVFADGLRNEVGVRFDKQGRLWGVENGVDDLYRADLGGDISTDNPAEELNYLGHEDEGGLFFGYPYCWSSYNLTNYAPGTQFVLNTFQNQQPYSDSWCRDPNNVVPPKLAMGAHMAPLDILFWYSNTFPNVTSGDAFVSFHGSWDRNPPAGYRVDHVVFDKNGPLYNQPFLEYKGPGAYSSQWIRPVGLADIVINGTPSLLVTSDSPGQIILIAPTF